MATLKEQDIVLHTTDSSGNPVIQLPVTRLENVEGQDSKLVHTTGNETVAGTKTFSSSPIAPTPTAGDNSTKVATTAFVTTVGNAKAPTSHASSATTYGIGTGSNYGHVKLSDSTSSTSTSSSGIAATPKAVKAAYDLANTANTTANTLSTTKANDDVVVHLTGNETISGSKTFSATIKAGLEGFVTSDSSDKAIRISGGADYASGASVIVYGKDHADYPGVFRMRTTDGTNTADLDAWPNGEITWEGKNLVRSVNGAVADATGKVTLSLPYLPLAGGKMTGGINTAVEGIIVGSDDTVGLRISGGTGWNNGASVVVYGKDHASYPGMFRIKAEDGTNEYILLGKPDGTLTWGGKNVITSAGGTFTGKVTLMSGDNSLVAPTDNGYIEIEGGTSYLKGAKLTLYGKDYVTSDTGAVSGGHFRLSTMNEEGNDYYHLIGRPDGKLYWRGQDVERVASQSLGSSGYIRYASGLQICWGRGVKGTVTFPVPFYRNPSIVTNHWTGSATGGTPTLTWAGAPSTTGFAANTVKSTDGSAINTDLDYIAIGDWK